MSPFQRSVFALVRRVPEGAVVTYGQVAALVGAPRSARAVGHAMRHCPFDVPWHRVVNGHGGISLRANLESVIWQRLRLEQEGVRLRRGRIDLARYGWRATRREGRGRGAASAR
ncbi:MAG: MGMT family protein [Candidatus Rokuibacteriota bacterium]